MSGPLCRLLMSIALCLSACDARSFWGDSFLVDTSDPECSTTPNPCHACGSNADCSAARPVCDTAQGYCRSCLRNDECGADGVCVQESWPGDATAAGSCAPAAQVCHVNAYQCGSTADGSSAHPYCGVGAALSGCSGSYLAITTQAAGQTYPDPLQALGRSLYVTALGPAAPTLPSAAVSGAGSTLVVYGVNFDHGAQPGEVIGCLDRGSLRLRQVQARGGDVGVSADGCQELDLWRALITGNALDGVSILPGSTRYRISNCIIAQNGSNPGALASGVTIGLGATGTFSFNTIVQNGVPGDDASGGVVCEASAQITDSIIDNNAYSMTNNSQVDSNCSLLRVALGVEGASRPGTLDGAIDLSADYRLTDASTCCIDKARTDASIVVDYFGTRRPQRNAYDVGADELP